MTNPVLKQSPGGLLASLFLVSNRPQNFVGLCDNIETTVRDPSRIELLVKVDLTDERMRRQIEHEQDRRSFRIRTLITPAPRDHFELWKSLNELFNMIDSDTYFVNNINDEVRFVTRDWDDILARYIGLFPDHVFRLRVSRFRLRNYTDIWECYYAPDNYPFYSKRWIDLQGSFNACHVSDAFQQCVAFHLALCSYPGNEQLNRDVPLLEFQLANEEAGEGLSSEASVRRQRGSDASWYVMMSYGMQCEIRRRARHLQAAIDAARLGLADFTIHEVPERRRIELRDAEWRVFNVYSYHLNGWSIEWPLLLERIRGRPFHYREALNFPNEAGNFLGEPDPKRPRREPWLYLTDPKMVAAGRALAKFWARANTLFRRP